MIEVGDVIQFNENHKWTGCLGIISKIKKYDSGNIRYMVGVPVPQQGTAYIFVLDSEKAIEKVGKAIFVEKEAKND